MKHLIFHNKSYWTMLLSIVSIFAVGVIYPIISHLSEFMVDDPGAIATAFSRRMEGQAEFWSVFSLFFGIIKITMIMKETYFVLLPLKHSQKFITILCWIGMIYVAFWVFVTLMEVILHIFYAGTYDVQIGGMFYRSVIERKTPIIALFLCSLVLYFATLIRKSAVRGSSILVVLLSIFLFILVLFPVFVLLQSTDHSGIETKFIFRCLALIISMAALYGSYWNFKHWQLKNNGLLMF